MLTAIPMMSAGFRSNNTSHTLSLHAIFFPNTSNQTKIAFKNPNPKQPPEIEKHGLIVASDVQEISSATCDTADGPRDIFDPVVSRQQMGPPDSGETFTRESWQVTWWMFFFFWQFDDVCLLSQLSCGLAWGIPHLERLSSWFCNLREKERLLMAMQEITRRHPPNKCPPEMSNVQWKQLQ